MNIQIRWNPEWNRPTAIGAVSFGVGAAVGYAICWHRTKLARSILESVRDVVDQVEEEIEEEQPHLPFDKRLEEIEEWTTSRVINEIDIQEVGLDPTADGEIEVIVLEEDTEIEIADYRAVNRSVFPANTPEWDYDVEIAKRTSEHPYIIHRDEYMNEEAEGYSQSTLTFYQGDEVLVDEQEIPIYDANRIVGTDNLVFGKGSEDPSIVYIRNDKMESEWEIILDTGYYQVEVLGAEIEHSFDSRKSPILKFRD